MENGQQTPTDDDIRGWTRATGSRRRRPQSLLASLHTLEVQHAEWQRVLEAGLQSHQHELAELDEKTQAASACSRPPSFRACCRRRSTPVPGSLQVVMVHQGAQRHQRGGAGPDAAARDPVPPGQAVPLRADRGRAALPLVPAGRHARRSSTAWCRSRRCPTCGWASSASRPSTSTDPWHGFWLLRQRPGAGSRRYSAELNLPSRRRSSCTPASSSQLAAVASYGSAARAIITRVIDDLAAEVDGGWLVVSRIVSQASYFEKYREIFSRMPLPSAYAPSTSGIRPPTLRDLGASRDNLRPAARQRARSNACPSAPARWSSTARAGLSLNHIQGCPLDCAYCIRHTYGLWDQRQPRALMTDAEAVDAAGRTTATSSRTSRRSSCSTGPPTRSCQRSGRTPSPCSKTWTRAS